MNERVLGKISRKISSFLFHFSLICVHSISIGWISFLVRAAGGSLLIDIIQKLKIVPI